MRFGQIITVLVGIFGALLLSGSPLTAAPGALATKASPHVDQLVLETQGKRLTPQQAKRISNALKQLSALRRKFGAKHPRVAQAMFGLALLYERVGQTINAKRYYSGAYNIWRTALGPNHPQTRKAQAKIRALAATQNAKPKPKVAKRGFKNPSKPTFSKKKEFRYEPPTPARKFGEGERRAVKKSTNKTVSKKSVTRSDDRVVRRRSVQKSESRAPENPVPPGTSETRTRNAPVVATPPPPPSALERETPAPMIAEESFDDGSSLSTDAYTNVRVYYATDRNNTGSAEPAKVYGWERSSLQYGYCDVSIPKDHRVGEIERPSYWKLEFWEDPERHVVLRAVKQQDKDGFFGDIRRRVRRSKDGAAFIFIHGYNTTFEHAAHRTAQMTFDLGFDGAPVFYSWPSQGTTAGYTIDENNNRWTETHLKGFIQDFVKRSTADKIFLVAHSMGSRALSHVMTDLAIVDPSIKDKIEAIILAAPDIDADVFKRDIVPRMSSAAKSMTLYASKKDRALLASKQIHGYPRAGDAGDGLVVAQGLDTIDASEVDTSLFGHAYFAEEKSIIDDLVAILREGLRAEDRSTVSPVDSSQGKYWKIRKANN